jgi:DNA-binding GntR family transcriptional regulator
MSFLVPSAVVEDPRLHVRIREQLAARIIDGTYPAGEHMPALPRLIAEFGVSADTIQRAMLGLEAAGLVRRIPGLGYYSLGNAKEQGTPVDDVPC